MPYSAALTDAVSRVRYGVGDVTDPSIMPGGETVYAALLTAYGDDEAQVIRAAARGLAAYYATQPDSLGSSGESISWRSRVDQWNRIAAGAAGTAGAAASESPFTLVPAVYRDTSANDEFSR